MRYKAPEDLKVIEAQMAWADRRVPVTLAEFLRQTRDRHGPRPAVSFQLLSGPKDKAETLSWTALYDRVLQSANLFRRLGVEENDAVVYILPICNEAVITLIGGMIAGIASPINPLLSAEQIGALLNQTGAKVVVTLKPFPKTDLAQKVRQALTFAPNVKTVLEVDLNRYLSLLKSWIVPFVRPKLPPLTHRQVSFFDFNAALEREPTTLSYEEESRDRVAAYFHTGGTTGMPKIVRHKYSGMIYNGWLGAELLFNEEDIVLCPLPLFHVFACQVVVQAMLASGMHVVFPTPQGYRGDGVFKNFWKLVARWKATFVITVPTAISALMQHPIDADVTSLKTAFSGSAPLPNELIKKFETMTGVQLVEGYGLTEATCLVSCNPVSDRRKIGSVGLPFPYTEIKIFQNLQDGELVRECASGEVGEICISNPGVYVGQTYTDAKQNKGLYVNERYLRTGDLGRLDEDGYLFITGRIKDLIIRGGHNIDPSQIEEGLAGHPLVAAIGAVGQPDARLGERPCAYVEVIDGAEVTPEELVAYASEHIGERAAWPKYIEIVEDLPKTAVGKISKLDLRKMAIVRVYNAALAQARIGAEVARVEDDKVHGLVAKITPTMSGLEQSDVRHALGDFIYPWAWDN